MTDIERQILQNQYEILWVLNLALGKLLPDLVGRGGETDMMRADLVVSAKATKALLDRPQD